MRPVLFDSNARAAFMLYAAKVVYVVAHGQKWSLNRIVLGELIGGVAAGTREPTHRAEPARFLDAARIESRPVTAEIAEGDALVGAGLRRRGRPLPASDLCIETGALQSGAALLTRDGHFSHIDGLRCGRRLADFLP